MSFSSYLHEVWEPLVLDASVLINLRESSFGLQILRAVPNELIVPKIVVHELDTEPGPIADSTCLQNMLAKSENLTVANLTEIEHKTFETLISGTASLDDGEAATIAIAVHRGGLPVIDERKGRAVAIDRLGGKEPAWSLDILRHPRVIDSLGESAANDALYRALRFGRMRIDAAHCDAVVENIGIGRALNCDSLPNFSRRRTQWELAGHRKEE